MAFGLQHLHIFIQKLACETRWRWVGRSDPSVTDLHVSNTNVDVICWGNKAACRLTTHYPPGANLAAVVGGVFRALSCHSCFDAKTVRSSAPAVEDKRTHVNTARQSLILLLRKLPVWRRWELYPRWKILQQRMCHRDLWRAAPLWAPGRTWVSFQVGLCCAIETASKSKRNSCKNSYNNQTIKSQDNYWVRWCSSCFIRPSERKDLAVQEDSWRSHDPASEGFVHRAKPRGIKCQSVLKCHRDVL